MKNSGQTYTPWSWQWWRRPGRLARYRDRVATQRAAWVDGRVEVLLSALAEFGMTIPRSAAAELVHERARWAAAHMHTTPRGARGIAGLAEAIQIRLRERDDITHVRDTVDQLAHTLSALGQILADTAPVTGDNPGARSR